MIQDGGIARRHRRRADRRRASEHDLGGVNTYTGATTIMAGATPHAVSNGSIAPSSGVTLAGAGAHVRHLGGNGTARRSRTSPASPARRCQLGSNALTVGTANSTTFAGITRRQQQTPGGAWSRQGSGTLTLTANNTYTGGTTINAGLINFNSRRQLRHRHDHAERRRPAVG